jgi:hypothetical protein
MTSPPFLTLNRTQTSIEAIFLIAMNPKQTRINAPIGMQIHGQTNNSMM